MKSLFKKIEERMLDPKLNENFNREVSKKCDTTSEDILNYELASEAFQEYKKKDPNWMKHFE